MSTYHLTLSCNPCPLMKARNKRGQARLAFPSCNTSQSRLTFMTNIGWRWIRGSETSLTFVSIHHCRDCRPSLQSSWCWKMLCRWREEVEFSDCKRRCVREAGTSHIPLTHSCMWLCFTLIALKIHDFWIKKKVVHWIVNCLDQSRECDSMSSSIIFIWKHGRKSSLVADKKSRSNRV